MKILLQAYNTFGQNPAGGVRTKVMKLYEELRRICGSDAVELFDKWTTNIDSCDVIHFFKASPDHYGLMSYARSKGKKIVLSSIVPLAEGPKIRAHMALNRLLPLHTMFEINKREFDMSDLIITESRTETEFIRHNYGIRQGDKFIDLPNGVSSATQDGDPSLIRRKLSIDGEFVLQVGRIDSNKNQLRVIKALKGTGIPLVIVGGPDPQQPGYMETCQSEADDNVYFTGWLKPDDPLLASAYAAAKVLVCPSLMEIYGNVIAEGASAECNIVCSNTIPFSDWGKTIDCLLRKCDPLSVPDIREKITDAFTAPVAVGQSKLFRDFFSWERIARQHIELYHNL